MIMVCTTSVRHMIQSNTWFFSHGWDDYQILEEKVLLVKKSWSNFTVQHKCVIVKSFLREMIIIVDLMAKHKFHFFVTKNKENAIRF